MNHFESIAYALMLGRRMGKTYQTAQSCKAIGATMICHNLQEAKRVAKEYGIKTVSLNTELRGCLGPFLIDPTAVEFLCREAHNQLKEIIDQSISYQQALRSKEIQYEELVRKLNLLCQNAKTEKTGF